MPEKLAAFIVDKRRYILAFFALAAVLSVFMIPKTVINYDFTRYLSESTVTRRSLDLMETEFGSIDQISVLFTSLEDGVCAQIAEDIQEINGISRAVYSPDSDLKYLDGVKYERLNIYTENTDMAALSGELERYLSSRADTGEFSMHGSAPESISLQRRVAEEMPLTMLIAVAVVIAVLFVTSHSYIEPVVFALVLTVSILINMGTNFIFDSISFITFAVSAILQLALAMDYSIMLLRTYFELRDGGMDDTSALKSALQQAFMLICSSSLTTVAGLGSLMFMSFTIGFDIGIVLSKGIIISMISVFTLMPALIRLFAKPLRTTMHKPLPLGGRHLGRFACTRFAKYAVPAVLIPVIIVSFVLQGQINYTFTDTSMRGTDSVYTRLYGRSEPLALLVPSRGTDADYETQRALIKRLSEIEYEGRPAVSSVAAMVTSGAAALEYYTAADLADMLGIGQIRAGAYLGLMGFTGNRARADELAEKAAAFMPDNAQAAEMKALVGFAKGLFQTDDYARIVLSLDIPPKGEASFGVLEEIISLAQEFYPNEKLGFAGILMSSYDISGAFTSDILRVNLITILAIFLIVALSFRSLSVPLILIFVIQGAVMVNMASSVIATRLSSVLPKLFHERSVFFMCYLICLAIQMGATIDYGILLTTHYINSRKTEDKHAAMASALRLSMPTIFTSGLILFTAGLAIGLVCTVYYIYSIGLLIASGTFFSLVMVLILLPPLLLNCDKLIMRKRGKV